jgi:neutral ceramidase
MFCGTGKSDITLLVKGAGMMGYGDIRNKAFAIDSPVYVRTVVVKQPDGKNKFAFINAEICFITIAIKNEVVKRLKLHFPDYGDENILLTAQHTHSNIGGYSHYPFYNFTIPGFIPEIFDNIVSGIVNSVMQAEKNLQPATIELQLGIFEKDVPVAFNRSIKAYNANPDVEKVNENENFKAVDRNVTQLLFKGASNKPLALINWFGVHTTSLSKKNTRISSDNKGFASAYTEEEMKEQNPGFIAIFAQGPCGDITPNFIYDRKQKRLRGKFEDDFKSARFNGNLQYEKAREILNIKGASINGNIHYDLLYGDLSSTEVDPEFTNHIDGLKTSKSAHGVDFFTGTAEGPGMPFFLGEIIRKISRIVRRNEIKKGRPYTLEKYLSQGKKDIFIETGTGKILGSSNLLFLGYLSFIDPTVSELFRQYKRGSLKGRAWVPQILPVQLIFMGNLAIAGIPGEITTVAGRRLKQSLIKMLQTKGIEHVILSPYANAYMGYITTPEEYDVQCYEGGHTVYGKWTFPAFQTLFKKLVMQSSGKEESKVIEAIYPENFSKEELSKRTYTQ